MDSYLVRIYRRPGDEADAPGDTSVMGLVRPIEGDCDLAFRNVTELWQILRHGAPEPRPRVERDLPL